MTTLYHHYPLAFLRLEGPDALRYLNGQVTQNVETLHENAALWTAITNAKGGIEAVAHLRKLGEGNYLLDCPAPLGDLLEERLDRYLIADDCTWHREDEQWALYTALGGSVIDPSALALQPEGHYESNRLRSHSTELLFKTKLRPGATSSSEFEILPSDSPAYQEARIRSKVPAWEAEIMTGSLPTECGLEELALSYEKGCYIGQEIISRIKASGKKRMQLYFMERDHPYQVGEPISGQEGKTIGKVTSTVSAVNSHLALALCKQAP